MHAHAYAIMQTVCSVQNIYIINKLASQYEIYSVKQSIWGSTSVDLVASREF